MGADTFKVLAVEEFANSEIGTLTNSTPADVLCVARVRISFNGTPYWFPLFDAHP